MQGWWQGLTGFQQTLYIIAIPFTIILVLQTILSISGVDFGGDSELDGLDGDFEAEDMLGFKFFSLRGVLAFFTVFGWLGLVLSKHMASKFLIVLISALAGAFAMVLIGWMFSLIAKLQETGNVNYNRAIGKQATVYMTIPKLSKGRGKIQVTVSERLREMEAVTGQSKDLKTGTVVLVEEVLENNIARVKEI